jgi:dihydroflavonol-4-reductase
MRILVTGATGFLGQFAVAELLASGHEIRALVRDRDRAVTILGRQPEIVAGDAMDRNAVRTALSACDGLLHSAAVYSYDRRDIARVQRDTPALAAAVLGAAADARIGRVVDVASAVVYTTATDRVSVATRLVQTGDPTWRDPYVRAKLAAEQTGMELERKGLPRVTLLPSRVLGPRDRGPGTSGASLIAQLRGGVTTDARGGWVDVRDVASAAVAAFSAPVGTHVIVSASSMPYRELAPLLDRLTGRHPRRIFLGKPAIRLLARLNDAAGGWLAPLPTAGALEYVLTSPPVDGSSGTDVLGIHYRPLEDTLTDAIGWWAANGTIDRKLAGKLAA